MRALDRVAMREIDNCTNTLAFLNFAFENFNFVNPSIALLLGIEYSRLKIISDDLTDIADLPPAFGVERRTVKYYLEIALTLTPLPRSERGAFSLPLSCFAGEGVGG